MHLTTVPNLKQGVVAAGILAGWARRREGCLLVAEPDGGGYFASLPNHLLTGGGTLNAQARN